MIDPKHVNNQNLFDLDYASCERKHYLKNLHAAPRFLLAIEEIVALISLWMQCVRLVLAKRSTRQVPATPAPGQELE